MNNTLFDWVRGFVFGRGVAWLKKMKADRLHNFCRLMCDKAFMQEKLDTLGDIEEKRDLLAAEFKKVRKNKNGEVIEDKSDRVLVKKLNDEINVYEGVNDQLKQTELKLDEFTRYLGVVDMILADPDRREVFNHIWEQKWYVPETSTYVADQRTELEPEPNRKEAVEGMEGLNETERQEIKKHVEAQLPPAEGK